MPFKTKKQKLHASQNRFIYKSQKIALHESNPQVNESKNLKLENTKMAALEQHESIEKLNYLKRDFIKIMIGSAVIIAAQIMLSLTLR